MLPGIGVAIGQRCDLFPPTTCSRLSMGGAMGALMSNDVQANKATSGSVDRGPLMQATVGAYSPT